MSENRNSAHESMLLSTIRKTSGIGQTRQTSVLKGDLASSRICNVPTRL